MLFCISKAHNYNLKKINMKKIGLLSTALFLSFSVFAQSEAKNVHGTEVSSTAKASTEIETKGATVSSVASAKSQATVKREVNEREAAKEARKARKSERQEMTAELRAEQKAEVAALREEVSNVADGGKDAVGLVRAEAKSNVKAGLKGSKEELLEAKADLRARKKELRKAARKERSIDLPATAKVKAGTGANVQLRRPKIKGNLSAGAALGL